MEFSFWDWVKKSIQVSRPLFWLNVAIPVLWVIILLEREATWTEFWLWFILLFPYNFFLHAVNDYYDYESDKKNPRKGGVEGALLPKATVARLAWWSVVVIIFATALPSPGWDWWTRGAWLIFLFISGAYSMPPFRFKSRPVLDGLSNFHYAGGFFIAWFAVRDSLTEPQFFSFILFTMVFCFWAMAANWLTGIVDRIHDKEAGITTTAVAWGQNVTARVSWIFFIIAAALSWYGGGWLIALGFMPYIFLCYSAARANEAKLRRVYQFFWGWNVIFGFAISIGLLSFRPEYTWWYYGNYFVASLLLVGIGILISEWDKIRSRYIAKNVV